MSAGKTAKEEPLFPAHEQRTPEDHPRAGRGLRRGERELRQRAQTQRGHHGPKVRLHSNSNMNVFANTRSPDTFITHKSVDFKMCARSQGEVGLSELNAHITDRARDGCEGPSSHRSYQTAQQQVSLLLWLKRLEGHEPEPLNSQMSQKCP